MIHNRQHPLVAQQGFDQLRFQLGAANALLQPETNPFTQGFFCCQAAVNQNGQPLDPPQLALEGPESNANGQAGFP